MNSLRFTVCISLVVANLQSAFGFVQTSMGNGRQDCNEVLRLQQTKDDATFLGSESSPLSRRNFVGSAAAMTVFTGMSPSAGAAGIATSSDGNLPDLPNEAVRSYLQYRIPLQVAADYYVFGIQGMMSDIDQWGEVGQLFRVNNNKGQGQPSKIGR